MRPTLLAASWPGLFALATGFAATGCRNHIGIRGDIGLPVRPAVATATFGVGASDWNDHRRLALNAVAAWRPAGVDGIGAVLFEAEYNAFFHRRDEDRPGSSTQKARQLALVTRLGVGPASGDGAWVTEASLGLGFFTDMIHIDQETPETRYTLYGVAIEGFVARTAGVDTGAWLVGGRLSYAISGWSGPYPRE